MDQLPEPDTIKSKDRTIAASSKDHIPGWGIDADPENDPTYPMKHRNGADYERFNYEKPPQQEVDREILHSTERPGITRVFGTSTPPKGLSGALRRYFYNFSEATTAHWMGLIFADRVNVIEGYLEDFSKGTVPNIFKERGWPAEWKYNKKGVIKNAAIAVGVLAGVALIVSQRKKSRHR